MADEKFGDWIMLRFEGNDPLVTNDKFSEGYWVHDPYGRIKHYEWAKADEKGVIIFYKFRYEETPCISSKPEEACKGYPNFAVAYQVAVIPKPVLSLDLPNLPTPAHYDEQFWNQMELIRKSNEDMGKHNSLGFYLD